PPHQPAAVLRHLAPRLWPVPRRTRPWATGVGLSHCAGPQANDLGRACAPSSLRTDVRTLSILEPAGAEVSRWRREQLVLSGFSLPLAARVARAPRYDLGTG